MAAHGVRPLPSSFKILTARFRSKFVTDTLEPIVVLLKENQPLAKDLETDPFTDPAAVEAEIGVAR